MKAYALFVLSVLAASAQAQTQPTPPPVSASTAPVGLSSGMGSKVSSPNPTVARPPLVMPPQIPVAPRQSPGAEPPPRNPLKPVPKPVVVPSPELGALPPGLPVQRRSLGNGAMLPPVGVMPDIPLPGDVVEQDPIKASGKRIGKLNGQDIFKLDEAYFFDQPISTKKKSK